MADHIFISYSVADGLDFATKLFNKLEGGHPHIDAWLDKNRLEPGDDWDEQIAKAIADCKCLVFALSVDSVAEGSTCKQEWVWALKYKKPVVPLLIDREAQLPFRLGSRQYIDFTSDFEAGLAKLRDHIAYLNSEEGKLDELKHRLEDANRDLRRAKPEDAPRVQADIDELKKQIEAQKKVVENPEAAKKQTEQNIQNGLERERKPQLPVASFQSSKFINQPPGVAQTYFQDRLMETEQAILFLKNEAQRVLTVVGRGGAGKTAMVCRLLKFVENGGLPDDFERRHGRVEVDGIVYLSEAGSRKVNFANLFEDLCKLLPAASAEKLSALYREPQTSTESKTVQLLAAFQGLKQVIVLLDNFENVVDAEKGQVRDAELDEALRAFLHAPHHPVKVIITTRVSARELDAFEPARQRLLPLDTGLQPEYAREAFVLMDEGNLVGIKNAGADLLNLAVTRTLGLPRALEALYAALRTDRFTTLQELLDLPILPEQVVQAYVGEAFNRLDTNAQKVMQALAVYNRPVTPAAVDYLLAPSTPAIDSAPILQRLANMHFARKESGRFYLHPVDREFAFNLLAKGDEIKVDNPELAQLYRQMGMQPPRKERNDFTQIGLTDRAASYYAQARKPRAEWKKLDDLSAQLAEFDLRCASGDYDTAASVVTELDDDYLLLWGHYRLVIETREKLEGKINDPTLARINIGNAGKVLNATGRVNQAIKNYKKALELARNSKNRQAESVWLGELGNAYDNLGDVSKALEFYENALDIAHEIGDQRGEGNWLYGLGNMYIQLGNTQKAIEFYQRALVVLRAIGDRQGEGAVLGNIGSVYGYLGDNQKAMKHQEECLKIAQEIKDRRTESNQLSNLGSNYFVIADFKKAIEYYQKSILIKQEIEDRGGESIVFGNVGATWLIISEYQKAKENYQRAVQIADEISFPQTQNGARCGLAQTHLFQNDLVNARATIEAALQYDVPENNHNASALHGIIALRQGEAVAARGAFVRAIGQADEILSKTAEYYDALDAKGLAICGLALTVGATRRVARTQFAESAPTEIDAAIETFRKARKIAPHAGVVKSVLRLFDELMKCEGGEILKDVREAIAPTITS